MIYINGELYNIDLFPNKEKIFKSFTQSDINIVTMFFQDDRDIFDLIMISHYLEDVAPACRKVLVMPYIPYSRMDRAIKNQLFSLKYFASIINDMNFDKIKVLDPHSRVSFAFIKNLEEIDIGSTIQSFMVSSHFLPGQFVVMFPDQGATEKYYKKCPYIVENYNIVRGLKNRDLLTGKIHDFHIHPDDIGYIKNQNVLIVDDICSKGGTFKHAASLLKRNGAQNIFLFVAHLEEAVFEGGLLDDFNIERIITTDSIYRAKKHPKIQVINLFI